MQNWLLQSRQYCQSLHSSLCHLLSSTQCHVNAGLTGLAELSILQSDWCHLLLCRNAAVSKVVVGVSGFHFKPHAVHLPLLMEWPSQFLHSVVGSSRDKIFFTSNISRLTRGPTHLHLVLRLRMSGAIPPLPHMLPWHTQGWLYIYIAFTVSSLPLTCSLQHFVFLYHDFMLHLQNKGPQLLQPWKKKLFASYRIHMC
jgi:hypothetical protein